MTLFPVTMVGSWPRSPELLRAQKELRLGKRTEAGFHELADAEILQLLRTQEDLGVDLVTDGELRRDNFYSFVADKLEGVRLMTLLELLDVIEDKQSFEQVLKTLDVPAYSLSNPSCVGPLRRKRPLAVDELKFVKQHTQKPVKIPLPGPYLLTRAMFVEELTKSTYPTKEALSVDVVKLLREEVADLLEEGADFIQFDEPVLTEIVFSPGNTRTFMCASLAASGDPTEELEFAVSLLNQVLEGQPKTATFGLHVCRGNWSQDETTLLSGNYHPLKPYFERMNVDQLVLEYATERAGDLMHFPHKSLGLGALNPRTTTVEPVEAILKTVQKALNYYAPEELYLNPDCGFGTFSNSPVNSREIATQKMRQLVTAARELRQGRKG